MPRFSFVSGLQDNRPIRARQPGVPKHSHLDVQPRDRTCAQRTATSFTVLLASSHTVIKYVARRSVCLLSRIEQDRVAKKILVADDNPIIRKTLRRLLEAQEHYELCVEAQNGEEAIALSIKHRPDLIILDLEMPVMNGIDAAHEIK